MTINRHSLSENIILLHFEETTLKNHSIHVKLSMPKLSELLAKHKKALSYLLIAGLIAMTCILLNFSRMVKDAENRWQRFFYDVRQTLPIQLSEHPYPIYLVELDDRSLPANSCRSPISNQWITGILEVISKHQPASVGLNILLQESSPEVDNKLAAAIDSLGNVVLLDHPQQPVPELFRSAAKSWGSMSYKSNSAGDVQYVCSHPRKNHCLGLSTTQRHKLFYKEILTDMVPDFDYTTLSEDDGWLRLFFQHTSDSLRQPHSSKPWTTLSASELTTIPKSALAEDALFLIGTNFSGLYPTYRLPLSHSSAEPSLDAHLHVSDLELAALVLDMVLNKTFIKTVPFWATILMLLLLMACLAALSWNSTSFIHFWLSVLFVILWNLGAAMGFAVYLLEIPSILPSLSLLIFSIYCLRYQQISAKLESYELKYQLEKERFNGLVDRFHSHSVFNALEHIRYLVRKKDEDVDRYILDYSTLLLDDLRHHPQQWYPLREQWDYTINYLELQNLKLGNRIDLNYNLSPAVANQTENFRLPWKLFFPLAENAFKYTKALIDSEKSTLPFIRIEMTIERSTARFSISNSFSEIQTVPGSKQGIANLKKRLSLLLPGKNWRLEQQETDFEWRSILEVPLEQDRRDIA